MGHVRASPTPTLCRASRSFNQACIHHSQKFVAFLYEFFNQGQSRLKELLACGGVTPDSIRPFFSCGASAVAFGGSVFQPDWLAARDYARIGESIEDLIAGFRGGDREIAGR
ncbi:MAG: hypothetical protein V3R87_09470 [Dehalococcoidia bacterium]